MSTNVYIKSDGRVTTDHHTDYKGYDLVECLQEIQRSERAYPPHGGRWAFDIVDGTICLTLEPR